MRKKLFVFLPFLFIFISCFPWDPPSPGTLTGYEVVFDNTDLCNGNIDVNISGTLSENHKNPVLYIYIRNDSTNISTDLYKLSGDYENLTHLIDSEKNEYLIWLGGNDIDHNLKIHMEQNGEYKLCCWIQADRTTSNTSDGYVKYLKFTY